MKKAAIFMAVSLALTACNLPGTPEVTEYGEVTGVVIPGVTLQSTRESASPFAAPRVAGQLLIRDGDALRAQTLGVLSGVRTEAVSDDLTRAFTPNGESDEAFAARLRASGLHVQPNYLYRALAAPTPNDPGYPGNAGILIGGTRYTQDYLTRINAKSGWDAAFDAGNTTLTGPVVAVLDTGVNAAHPDLQGRLLPGRDVCARTAVDRAGNVYCEGEDATPNETTGDSSGHGTFALGVIGATTNNGTGLAGLTWSGRNLLPVKVFSTDQNGSDFADTVSLTRGLAYAISQGARVVNMSVGFSGGNFDPALANELQRAYDAGAVLVAAAGNVALEGVLYPASDPRVLAVGSTVLREGREEPSSTSAVPFEDQRPVDLFAPGGDTTAASRLLGLSGDGGYTRRAGTSFAAPQVAGAAALLLQTRPNLSPEQVRRVLTVSGSDLGEGRRFLNVGAALREATPPPAPYTVTVTASRGTTVTQTFRKQTYGGTSGVPYSLTLPYGTYTLSASIVGGGVNLTGSRALTVDAPEEFGTDVTVR